MPGARSRRARARCSRTARSRPGHLHRTEHRPPRTSRGRPASPAAGASAPRSGRRRAAPRTARRRRGPRRPRRRGRARGGPAGGCSGSTPCPRSRGPPSARRTCPWPPGSARARSDRVEVVHDGVLATPMMMMMSVRPARTASSTTYWIAGLSRSGSISLGWALVAGRNRVPSPAAGTTAFRTFVIASAAGAGVYPRGQPAVQDGARHPRTHFIHADVMSTSARPASHRGLPALLRGSAHDLRGVRGQAEEGLPPAGIVFKGSGFYATDSRAKDRRGPRPRRTRTAGRRRPVRPRPRTLGRLHLQGRRRWPVLEGFERR